MVPGRIFKSLNHLNLFLCMFIFPDELQNSFTIRKKVGASYQAQIGTYQEHCQGLNNKGICHLPPWTLNPLLL